MDGHKNKCDESIQVTINHTAIFPDLFDFLMPTQIPKLQASQICMKIGSMRISCGKSFKTKMNVSLFLYLYGIEMTNNFIFPPLIYYKFSYGKFIHKIRAKNE